MHQQDIRLISPIINAKLPSPETLNKGFIIFLNIFPKSLGTFVLESNSVAIKKGRREGTTEFAHNFKPDFAAFMLLDEKSIKHIINIKNIREMTLRFNLKTNI